MDFESYIAADDKQIVEWALEGDKAAFEVLVGRYRDAIHTLYTKRYGLPTEDADDLTQETFIKAYLNLASFNRKSSFSTWLHSIGYNVLYDYLRTQKNTSTELEAKHSITTTSDRIDNSTDLYNALSILTLTERTCITLHYMEDISVADICNIIGLPSGTIKSHLSRARMKLSKFLKQNGYE